MLDDVNRALRALIRSQRCPLCRAAQPSATRMLCEGCYQALPWLIHACPSCALPRPDDSPCPVCARHPPPQDAAWSVFKLETPVHQAILRLKYQAGFSEAQWLADALADAFVRQRRARPDRLLPVPLHASRLRRRGYNQALEVARIAGQKLAIPVDFRSLVRVRATADQIGKSRSERRRNLHGAFSASTALDGLHVAILDDVMTTGSTLAEIARACRVAGAAHIEVWAIARAPAVQPRSA